MAKWTYDALAQAIAQFGVSGDRSDPKVRKRLKLVQAATELFVQQGYRKTSVDEIAQRAGVAKGTVYLYYKTKGELLLHAIIEEKKRYMQQLQPLLDEQVEPRERLHDWLRLALVLAQQMPLVSRLLSGDVELLSALEDMPPEAVDTGREVAIEFLGELLDSAAAPHSWTEHELRDRASVLYGLVHFSGLLTHDKVRGPIPIDRYAAILADMLINGIGPIEGRP